MDPESELPGACEDDGGSGCAEAVLTPEPKSLHQSLIDTGEHGRLPTEPPRHTFTGALLQLGLCHGRCCRVHCSRHRLLDSARWRDKHGSCPLESCCPSSSPTAPTAGGS